MTNNYDSMFHNIGLTLTNILEEGKRALHDNENDIYKSIGCTFLINSHIFMHMMSG